MMLIMSLHYRSLTGTKYSLLIYALSHTSQLQILAGVMLDNPLSSF